MARARTPQTRTASAAAARPDPGTRLRLIEAAGPVFAARGFEQATVREIVSAAGANVAAVNYHFGDKLALYRAVLEHYANAALAAHPVPDAGATGTNPAVALRAFIGAFLERLFHEGKPSWMSQIIAREMVEPTGAFEHLANVHMRPQIERLRSIVSHLTGLPPTDPRVQRSAASVIAQCVSYKQCGAAHRILTPDQTYDAAGRAALADHITAFSLAGIAAMPLSGGAGKRNAAARPGPRKGRA